MSYPFGKPFSERPVLAYEIDDAHDPFLRPLIFYLAIYCVPPVLLRNLWPSQFAAWIIILFGALSALVAATSGVSEAQKKAGRRFVTLLYFGFLPAAFVFVWAGIWVAGIWPTLVSTMLSALACGACAWLYSELIDSYMNPTTWTVLAGQTQPAELPTKPYIESSLILRHKRGGLEHAVSALSQMTVFSSDTPELAQAWRSRDGEKIENLLKEGDALTRANWEGAIALFNSSIGIVEVARNALRLLLAESEKLLVHFGIDCDAVVIPSRSVEGFMPMPPVRQTFVTERLDYAQGYGSGLARVATGQIPWQAAAVVMIGVGIWALANQSKILRQLKEIEGKILENAAAAEGDFRMFGRLIEMRMMPQLDALADSVGKIETATTELDVDSDMKNTENREKALRLAFAVLEGKKCLEMTGGD